MHSTRTRAALSVMSLALLPAAALLAATTAPARTIAPGGTWEVAETTTLAALTLGAGASVVAPPGHSLTLTVDGVETPLRAGRYRGRIVLTPARDIDVHFDGMGTKQLYKYRTAVYVNDGLHEQARSVPAAATGGRIDGAAAEDLRIASVGEQFTGIMVAGDSTYAIRQPVIELTGNGRNDFNGVGAGIRASGTSRVTIDNARIRTAGAVRTAIWVGEHADVTVNNADIEVRDGTLPASYGWSWARGGGGTSGDVMMEVPWMLGLRGNNRATLVVGSGTARYNNSRIRAQAWGALSTDAVQEARVYATQSHIETVEHGYGAYADGNSLVHSSGSSWDVADYGLIMSGGSGVFTDGSVVNSRRIGIMSHGGRRGTLTIDKGSAIHAAKAAIQLKGASPTILVDGATLTSKSGLILQAMVNDDPNMNGPGAPGGGGPGGPPGGGPPSAGGPPGGGAPTSGQYSASDGDDDIDATFRNVTLEGDFVNALTAQCGMNLRFENARVSGAITTATARHATGPRGEQLRMQDSGELYYLVGEQIETYGPTEGPHGLDLTLGSGSEWTVAKTSYLTGLTLAPDARIVAPAGRALTLTVDGVATPITAGIHKGRIVLAVSP